VVLFGTAWPAMKIGVADATPVWYAAARAGLSALTGFALVLALGRFVIPGRRDWPIVLSVGVFQLSAFFSLGNLGLGHIGAGRAVVLAYTISLWLVPLGWLVLGERLDRARLAGLALGLAGVAVLVNPFALDWSDRGVLIGHGCLLLAALSWALAVLHARAHRWQAGPLQLVPWQMAVATVVLAVVGLLFEPDGRIGTAAPTLLALAYLGTAVGPVATWAATSVSRALPTLVSAIGFLAVPALGVLVSAWALGEPITADLALGAGLILLGAGIVSYAAARTRR